MNYYMLWMCIFLHEIVSEWLGVKIVSSLEKKRIQFGLIGRREMFWAVVESN